MVEKMKEIIIQNKQQLQEVLESGKNVIIEKERQVGATGMLLEYCSKVIEKNENISILFLTVNTISIDRISSRFDSFAKFRSYPINTRHCITFSDNIREECRRYDLIIIDEFAWHRHPEQLLFEVKHYLNNPGRIIICSSPLNKDVLINVFNKLYDDAYQNKNDYTAVYWRRKLND